jgi:hypothetical protein
VPFDGLLIAFFFFFFFFAVSANLIREGVVMASLFGNQTYVVVLQLMIVFVT